MKSPRYFIVSPVNGKRYNNTINISGVDFITSTDDENHLNVNREAVCHAVPANYNGPVKPGDILLVHHNVFRLYNDMTGYQKSGRSFLKDDQFFVEPEQFYMYKRNGMWMPYGENSFARVPDAGKTEAELVYVSNEMKRRGLKSGDMVAFVPGCIYEFGVDGEVLYRIMDNHIVMQWDNQIQR